MRFLEEQEKEIYDFIKKYNADFSFKEMVYNKYINEPGNLSILEIYVLEEILRVGNRFYFNNFVNYLKHGMKEFTGEFLVDNYGYSPFNNILTDNETNIKKSLTNLLFGELIFDTLNKDKFAEIKNRQKEPGLIANIDKLTIIEELQKGFKYNFACINNIVDRMYSDFLKFGGTESNYFKSLLRYNTNISFEKIIDIKNQEISKQKRK